MPRFFFDTDDGYFRNEDDEGFELPSINAAASRRWMPSQTWPATSYRSRSADFLSSDPRRGRDGGFTPPRSNLVGEWHNPACWLVALPLLQQADVRNKLLKALPPEDFASLRPALRAQEMPLRQVLISSHTTIETNLLPRGGLRLDHQRSTQRTGRDGLIGREGLVGAAPICWTTTAVPHPTSCRWPVTC